MDSGAEQVLPLLHAGQPRDQLAYVLTQPRQIVEAQAFVLQAPLEALHLFAEAGELLVERMVDRDLLLELEDALVVGDDLLLLAPVELLDEVAQLEVGLDDRQQHVRLEEA